MKENTIVENVLQNNSSCTRKIVKILYSKNPKVAITKIAPIIPNSSDKVAKIKSVFLSGRNRRPDCVPKPNPRPNNIPDPTAITDWIAL